jgi:putative thioredoxin
MADSPWITDVTQATFQKAVIERSHQVPVLVDFWAPWCAPCRMLTPVLVQLATDYQGKFFLAKVNTDIEQQLALDHRIRGIPDVKIFRDGKVVGGFVGVQPASAIRTILDRFVPSETDVAVREALALANQNRVAEAVAMLRQAVAKDSRHAQARVELARLLLTAPGEGHERREEVERMLSNLPIEYGSDPVVEGLRTKLSFLAIVEQAPPLDELERRIKRNPGDSDARYRLSAYRALAGDYEPAMQELLEIVQRDRNYGDDAARKALVGIFALLGNDPRVPKYRALLSRALH